MSWIPAGCLLALVACGRIAFEPGALDACTPQTFYPDVDGDGHGDLTAPIEACTQPADAVATGDDCDDTERHRYAGALEVCDGVDNDCNPGTAETCTNQCVPRSRPATDDAHTYLVCAVAITWPMAHDACAAEGFTLAQIDDAAETDWLVSTLAMAGIGDSFIGGSDLAVEGTWQWPDNTPFWQGGETGTAIGGRYTNWKPLEPNNGGAGLPENCLLMYSDGTWNDSDCGPTIRAFACERL